jgi:hypothetical protein
MNSQEHPITFQDRNKPYHLRPLHKLLKILCEMFPVSPNLSLTMLLAQGYSPWLAIKLSGSVQDTN